MNKLLLILTLCFLTFHATAQGDWISLFDGKSLDGWKISENPASFSIEEGVLKVDGKRAHLFYDGPIGNHDFKNFEFKAEVKTKPGANSGIFIHTQFQEEGWPSVGYEIQVNQTHSDWRKTGSLYSVNDVKEVFVKDNEWYTQHIIVKGDKITVKINDKVVMEYVESEDKERDPAKIGTQKLSSGTIALQAHDPKSVIYYKNIQVKLLP
ncbi:hypothetical protein P872_22860 [Rhodonellum psychrophilum GCM71 = DSM 17998]|uniref:3-keto-alpha-glucoside-1,2-lyase/3-keto-2-hydroxy-glucal hydratase domain-containing protein n=2 Tax=Rhodonellum TaxID=336827 RepID=U5BW93_9BACT|nr:MULTISPECIES: DUF1080 domain-containing protein [Rhodonellum]ERM84905.1 hypothetical protein P872_22860 [Rhodonellum psychrophilum GCM71 = DSM 17998]SDY73312.1 protein of unknown function [Rhodonellum ikkaensis]